MAAEKIMFLPIYSNSCLEEVINVISINVPGELIQAPHFQGKTDLYFFRYCYNLKLMAFVFTPPNLSSITIQSPLFSPNWYLFIVAFYLCQINQPQTAILSYDIIYILIS